MIETQEDQTKFISIYETYRGLMFVRAKSILNHYQDAEDAVQQAFVRIATNIQTVDTSSPERLRSLVMRITECSAIDLRRKRERHEKYKYECLKSDLLNQCNDQIDIRSAIDDCLARLPEKYRNIILLRCCHGYEIEQIAKVMNMSVGNTYKTFSRAKRKFKQIYFEMGGCDCW